MNENVSPGMPGHRQRVARLGTGLAGAAVRLVQVWVMLSGLYWKTVTSGTGTGRNVGERDQRSLQQCHRPASAAARD